jgi:hypothetical protein
MPAYGDRVKDTTTTTGTGNITLDGAPPSGYQSFNAAVGTNAWFTYAIVGGAEWEVGLGYLSASTTLVRSEVYESSNSNAAVNFSAGTKTVILTWAAYSAESVQSMGIDYAMSRGFYTL